MDFLSYKLETVQFIHVSIYFFAPYFSPLFYFGFGFPTSILGLVLTLVAAFSNQCNCCRTCCCKGCSCCWEPFTFGAIIASSPRTPSILCSGEGGRLWHPGLVQQLQHCWIRNRGQAGSCWGHEVVRGTPDRIVSFKSYSVWSVQINCDILNVFWINFTSENSELSEVSYFLLALWKFLRNDISF